MYDDAAWLWHSIVSLLGYNHAYKDLFDALAADGWLRGLAHGAKALDGGIGTAALSIALAKTMPCVREIHGIDIAPRMLARARDELQLLARPDLTTQLHHGDVDQLPYPACEFDMVMSAHLLEHSSDPSETVRQMVRVLRVGGPFLMLAQTQSAHCTACVGDIGLSNRGKSISGCARPD